MALFGGNKEGFISYSDKLALTRAERRTRRAGEMKQAAAQEAARNTTGAETKPRQDVGPVVVFQVPSRERFAQLEQVAFAEAALRDSRAAAFRAPRVA